MSLVFLIDSCHFPHQGLISNGGETSWSVALCFFSTFVDTGVFINLILIVGPKMVSTFKGYHIELFQSHGTYVSGTIWEDRDRYIKKSFKMYYY